MDSGVFVMKISAKKPPKVKPKGMKLLAFVVLSFGLLFLIDASKGMVALQKSVAVIKILIPIFAIVILLMALIGYFTQGKSKLENLARQRGVKGWFWALFIGLLSHGPMYAWYPILQQLREKGLRDGYIATFFYARAVKLPLLPLMVDYFGFAFTVVLTLYIMIASLLQGWLVEMLERKKSDSLAS
jgi:uncharacterized membrane protein YraQ (UPF0718 family)